MTDSEKLRSLICGTDDDLQSLLRAFQADQRMTEVASYVKRGRSFAHLDREVLELAWAAAFCDCFPNNPTERDLAIELSLRDLDLPIHLVEKQLAAIQQALIHAMETRGVDEQWYDEFLADFAEFRVRLAKPRN